MKINFTKSLMTLLVVAFAMTLNAQDTLTYIWGGPASTGAEYDNSTFNGGPNDWTTEGFSSLIADSTHNALWMYSDADTLGGHFFGTRTIVTPTRENGYMVFDSDWLDNGGTKNFASGLAPAPQISGMTSPALDFSSNAGVTILFYQNYRRFNGRTVLQVSNDGGTTWTDFSIPQNDAVAVNNGLHSALNYVIYDISSVAANQGDVRVRFLWTTPIDAAAQNEGYYFWAVDDVAFIEPLAPDLAFSDYIVPAATYSQPSLTGVECDIMAFQATVTSLTGSVVYDVPLMVEVLDPAGTVVHTDEQMVDTITASGVVYDFETTWAPLNDVGLYTVRYTLGNAGDGDYTNNSAEGNFNVTESTFNSGPSFWGYPYNNVKDIYAQGVRYFTCDFSALDVEVKKVSYSVSAIGGQDLVDEEITLWVKKVLVDSTWFPISNDQMTTDFSEKDGTDWDPGVTASYILTADSDGANHDVTEFTDNTGETVDHVMIEPNSNYVFAVVTKGYVTNVDDPEIGIGIGNTTKYNSFGGTSFLIIDDDSYTGWNGIGPADITVELGMVTDTKTPKLADNALVVVQNPVRDELRLNISLEHTADIGYAVASMNGSILQMGSWKNVQNTNETLNVSDLANGQYLVRIQTKDGVATKTFIVAK